MLIKSWNTHLIKKAQHAIIEAFWGAKRQWLISEVSGQRHIVTEWDVSVALPRLIILLFVLKNGQKRSLILCEDAVDSESFRQLKVAIETGVLSPP